MAKSEYTIKIQIHEARDLRLTDDENSEIPNPYLYISVFS